MRAVATLQNVTAGEIRLNGEKSGRRAVDVSADLMELPSSKTRNEYLIVSEELLRDE